MSKPTLLILILLSHNTQSFTLHSKFKNDVTTTTHNRMSLLLHVANPNPNHRDREEEEEEEDTSNGNNDNNLDQKTSSGVSGKFRSWLDSNTNSKIVEHIPVPTSYEENVDDVDSDVDLGTGNGNGSNVSSVSSAASTSAPKDAYQYQYSYYTNANANANTAKINNNSNNNSNNAVEDTTTVSDVSLDQDVYDDDCGNAPEWFRQKQTEATRVAQSLDTEAEISGNSRNNDNIPEWLQDRMKLVTGDIDEEVRIAAAREIRSKQKELFRKLARGEITVSEDVRRKEGENVTSVWEEEDSPDWMVEQKQNKETDAWIQKKEMDLKVQSTRDNLIREQEKEKEVLVPDWYKQKEAEMKAKIEEAATTPIESSVDLDINMDLSKVSSDKGILDDDTLLDDEWFRQKEEVVPSNDSSTITDSTTAMPNWLKQKEEEMLKKLQDMEISDSKGISSTNPNTSIDENKNSVTISPDQRRDDILATLKSYKRDDVDLADPINTRNSVESTSRDNNDQALSSTENPSTPFFQGKTEGGPLSGNTEMDLKRPSVMDHAPGWLRDEISTDEAIDEQSDGVNNDTADEEFLDSHMFRDPSVDWIRSDPTEMYRTEKKKVSFSSFDPRWQRLMEPGVTLSVSELNALFDHDEINIRLHAQNKPESAYGAIFRLEGAIIDTSKMQEAVWTKLAEKYGFREPFSEDIAKAQMVPPDQAIRRIFYWTQDMLESREMALDHYDILQEVFDDTLRSNKLDGDRHIDRNDESDEANVFPIVDGALQWLERLQEVEIPCCVISQFDEEKLEKILNVTNLAPYFQQEFRVSANSGYDEEEQEYLGAALRIKRRPDRCAVFDSTPNSAVAAHDIDMRAISMMTLYPMYELRAADMIVETFEDLSVIDIRRLFWDIDYEPEIQLEGVTTSSDAPKRIKRWVDWDFPEQ